MRIEAITVCTSLKPGAPSYDDFLEVAARHNRGHFDRWIVVTAPWDGATRELARRWNMELLLTEEAHQDGQFRKGLMIQRAQRLLSADAWRLHLDADIVLPTTFRTALSVANLDPECIYGVDRVCVKSWQQWQDLLNSGYLSHQWDYHCRVTFPRGVEVGARWASSQQGFAPIGFMQLWHAKADEAVSFQMRSYPSDHGEASRSDTQMSLQWDRRKRVLLPEVIAVHLESEDAPMGSNWTGRKTKRFEPPQPSGTKTATPKTAQGPLS